MPEIIHMQSDRKYDEPGVPIHRLWTKWYGDPRFKTTVDSKQVTCKMCLRMLSKEET